MDPPRSLDLSSPVPDVLRGSSFDDNLKFHFDDDFPLSPEIGDDVLQNDGTTSPDSPYNKLLKDSDSDNLANTIGISISSFVMEHILSQPFIVLRKQCQVNAGSIKYHITPFTVIPTILTLHKQQGITTLWKGKFGMGAVLMIGIVTDTALAEATGYPKEMSKIEISGSFIRHIALKSLSYLLLTPLFASNLIQTVQNDISNESTFLDILKEGASRVFGYKVPRTLRLLPVYKLALPTTIYYTSHYVISATSTSLTHWLMMKYLTKDRKNRISNGENNVMRYFYAFCSGIVGKLTADVILYPMETIINRLYIQGTRTIIDDLDTGGVTSVITNYTGPIDCFNTIVANEGASGLFKGFGALMLQATLNVALLKLANQILVSKLEN